METARRDPYNDVGNGSRLGWPGEGAFVTHVVAEPCIGAQHGACVAVCPVDCIHPTTEDSAHPEEEMVYINPLTCIDCGLCVDECPYGAVFLEEDLPAKWQSFTERNAAYYARM